MSNSDSYSYPDLTNLIKNMFAETETFKSISDDLITLKPDPKSWCLGEIFEHLVRFNQIYLSMIRSAIDRHPKQLEYQKPFEPRLLMRPVIALIRPPYRLKIKTITPMIPVHGNTAHYRQQFHQLLDTNRELLQLIDDSDRHHLDLNRIKTRNKVFYIKMSLIEFILMFEAHQARHLWQAEQTIYQLTGRTAP